MTLGSFGNFGSTFNAPNYGRLSFARKERPCLGSSFLDIESPKYKVVAEKHRTMNSNDFTRGRIKPDCEVNKRPPRPPPRAAISAPRAVAEQVVHMSDSSARFPYHNRSGRMTDRGVPTDTIMVGADNTYDGRNDYIRATTSGGSLSATLVFPRSFNRGATSGLRQSPRFESPARKPYTSARHDVDPYGVRDANLWIKRPTRFTAKGAGVPHLPFGPTKLQRSPRSLADSMGQSARMRTSYHDPTAT